ncbi:MAG: hypothetical protein COT16_00155 [Elusimicrobia bacterium CG08_land_8_20_14_0_20_44_26]|nr:MAG: hypothetical protein COT16_00155 [Elusimicrobia bacterium CG08_land_8_20_14_0_20_44_26]
MGIGSLPFTDIDTAVNFSAGFDIPFWPQLPKRTYLENMYIQYAEGLPFADIDAEKQNIYFKLENPDEKELENFYEKILNEDMDYFAISKERAAGLHAIIDSPLPVKKIKGQIVGPASFGLTVTDENKKAVFYHDVFKEMLVKALTLKARWMIRELKKSYEEVYLFVDEPYLSQIGSAFVTLDPEEVKTFLKEMLDEINKVAVSGIHCCGETDWTLLLELPFKILSFDSYNYSLLPFAGKLNGFMENGGKILFGAVPAEKIISELTADKIKEKLVSEIEGLVKAGVRRELLMKNMMLSPSCGLATLTPELAVRAMDTLNGLKSEF